MKQYLAVIAHTQKELETYVSQLQKQGFETLGEVIKADDGSYYQGVAKSVRESLLTKPAKAKSEEGS